jgi:hypothetical protein
LNAGIYFIVLKLTNHVSLFHVDQERPQAGICLFSTREDLVRRQDETIIAGIPQLGREGIVRPDDVVDVVDAVPGRWVDRAADGPVLEGHTMHGLDGVNGAFGQSLQLIVLGGNSGARVAISWVPDNQITIRLKE